MGGGGGVTAHVLTNHDAEHCCENTTQGVGLKMYLEKRLDEFDLFSFFLPWHELP